MWVRTSACSDVGKTLHVTRHVSVQPRGWSFECMQWIQPEWIGKQTEIGKARHQVTLCLQEGLMKAKVRSCVGVAVSQRNTREAGQRHWRREKPRPHLPVKVSNGITGRGVKAASLLRCRQAKQTPPLNYWLLAFTTVPRKWLKWGWGQISKVYVVLASVCYSSIFLLWPKAT